MGIPDPLRDRRDSYRAYFIEGNLRVAIEKLMKYCKRRLRKWCETNRDTKRTTVSLRRLVSP